MVTARALLSTTSAALAPLVDLVFPPRCPACGAGIGAQAGLCLTCWSDLVIPSDPACAACRRPLPESVGEGALCAPCMAQPPRHAGIFAGTIYTDVSRQLVLSLKHGGRTTLAPQMARLIAGRLPDALRDGDALVVPVPLHRWRLWRRGFNQSALLARALARQTGRDLAVDALIRVKPTPLLGGLGKAARARALSGAIALRPQAKARIAGRDVILVDDVLTSGATSNACTAALLRGGARRVAIACFARVLDDSQRPARHRPASPQDHGEAPAGAAIPNAGQNPPEPGKADTQTPGVDTPGVA